MRMPVPNPTHIALPKDIAQALVNYLAGQPYRDVADLIAEIREASPITVAAPARRPEVVPPVSDGTAGEPPTDADGPSAAG
jgi:hypothetical protein